MVGLISWPWLPAWVLGCSWMGATEPKSSEEVAALKAEVVALRRELRTLREEVDVAHDVVADPPAPRRPAKRADFARLEGAVVEAAELVDAVDLDLEVVEGQLQDLQAKLSVTEAKVGSIESILNNHADGLDDLSAELGGLASDVTALRPLGTVLYVADGKVFVDGVDLVFKPGKNADGTPRSTGPVLVRPPIE